MCSLSHRIGRGPDDRTKRPPEGGLICEAAFQGVAGNPGRKMTKKCVVSVLSVLSRLLPEFFGFVGFLLRQFPGLAIDGGPEEGGAATAELVSRSD